MVQSAATSMATTDNIIYTVTDDDSATLLLPYPFVSMKRAVVSQFVTSMHGFVHRISVMWDEDSLGFLKDAFHLRLCCGHAHMVNLNETSRYEFVSSVLSEVRLDRAFSLKSGNQMMITRIYLTPCDN